MQVTAHFEKDFFTVMDEASRPSMDSLIGMLHVQKPINTWWLDAAHYVATNFPECDRRRLKRELRKAMKRALAGVLPGSGLPVFVTQEHT